MGKTAPKPPEILDLRQSQLVNGLKLSGLWDRRRQISRRHGVSEILALVRAVAEGLIGGMAAPTEGNRCASCQAESVALLVFHFEITFYFDWPVAEYGHFGCWQGILRWESTKFSLNHDSGHR